jgi:hypothetical protein
MAIKSPPEQKCSEDTLKQSLVKKVNEKFVARIVQENRDLIVNEAREFLKAVVKHKRTLSEPLKQTLCDSVLDECFGLGPLGALLRRTDVGDIYLEGPDRAYIEIAHELQLVEMTFAHDQHLLDVIHKLIGPLGGKLHSQSPLFAGTLPNGSKVYASIPPVSPHGPTLSIILRQQSALEIAPHWLAQLRYVEEPPIVNCRQNPDGANALHIQSSEDISDVYITQTFSARSFGGKSIHFSGTIDILSNQDKLPKPDTPGQADSLSQSQWEGSRPGGETSIRVYAEAWDRKGKRTTTQQDVVFDKKQAFFECHLLVPERTVRISVGLHLRGPMDASVSTLQFTSDKDGRKSLRMPQGPRNLGLHLE